MYGCMGVPVKYQTELECARVGSECVCIVNACIFPDTIWTRE